MSSRQTGRQYAGQGGSAFKAAMFGNDTGGSGGLQNSGLLSKIFGQDKMTGGLQQDYGPEGVDEGLSFTPYQGSSGIFGGASRNNAAMMNLQLGGQQLQTQGLQGLQSQAAQQELQRQQEAGKIAKDFASSQAFNAWAAANNVSPQAKSDLVQNFADEQATTRIFGQQNQTNAAIDPRMQEATTQGAMATQLAPAFGNAALTKQTAPLGGVASMQDINGNPLSLFGGTQNTESSTHPYLYNGIPMGTVQSSANNMLPGRAPINPNLFNSVPSDAQLQGNQAGASASPAGQQTATNLDTVFKDPAGAATGQTNDQQLSPTGANTGGMNPYVKAYLQFILGQAGGNLKGLTGNLNNVSF